METGSNASYILGNFLGMNRIKIGVTILTLIVTLTGCAQNSLSTNVGMLVSLDGVSPCLGVSLKRGIALGVEEVCSPDSNPVDEKIGWVFVANPVRGAQILVALTGSSKSQFEVVMVDKKVYRSTTDDRGFFAIRIAGDTPILYFTVESGRYAGQKCRPEAGFPQCEYRS